MFHNSQWNDDERYFQETSKLKVKCKCGHTKVIPKYVDKIICNHCGHYIYANTYIGNKAKFKDEFLKAKRRVNK